ncbi:MAG TPA: hypothetical protein VKG80_22515, partial [Trebonia sp.]|nr:hypothetical protein [Trebonia sp.]
ARWGLGALASTVNLNEINPPGSHPDALWDHTAAQWMTDMAILIAIGVICLAVTRWRLGKLGPGRKN